MTRNSLARLLLATYLVAFALPALALVHHHDEENAGCASARAFVAACADGCTNPEHHHHDVPKSSCDHTCPLCKLSFDWTVRLPQADLCFLASDSPIETFLARTHIPDQVRNAHFARAPPAGTPHPLV